MVRITSAMRVWHFETPGDAEGWAPTGQLTGFTVTDGELHATSTGGDPNMAAIGSMSLDASAGAVVEITMTSSILTQAQLFWGTADQPGAAEGRSVRFAVEAGRPYVHQVSIPPQSSPLTTFRFDPLTAPGELRIESIRMLR